MLKMPPTARLLTMTVAWLLAGALLGGCQSKEERLIPPPVVHTPLEIDPTAPPQATGWWFNGRHLLRLSPDASYALWESDNRYHVPRERGRWSQPSYAYVRMEPYSEHVQDARRVDFVRHDGEIALKLRGHDPFLAIDQPPRAPEDDLFGVWRSDAGALELYANMRYAFTSRTVTVDRPLMLAGHEGRWRLQNGVLTLRPNTPGMETIMLPVEGEGASVALRFSGGDFRREGATP